MLALLLGQTGHRLKIDVTVPFPTEKRLGNTPGSSGALSCQFQLLSFTTLFTWLESAAMPRFVFVVN